MLVCSPAWQAVGTGIVVALIGARTGIFVFLAKRLAEKIDADLVDAVDVGKCNAVKLDCGLNPGEQHAALGRVFITDRACA